MEMLAESKKMSSLELVEVTGAESMRHLGKAALGLLDLGLGRPDETIEELEFVERFAASRGLSEPAVAQASPNLIEAYYELGRAQWFGGDHEGAKGTWGKGATANRFAPWAKRCRELLEVVERGGVVPRSSPSA